MITVVSSPKQHLPKHMQHSVSKHLCKLKQADVKPRVFAAATVYKYTPQQGIPSHSLIHSITIHDYTFLLILQPLSKLHHCYNNTWLFNPHIKTSLDSSIQYHAKNHYTTTTIEISETHLFFTSLPSYFYTPTPNPTQYNPTLTCAIWQPCSQVKLWNIWHRVMCRNNAT